MADFYKSPSEKCISSWQARENAFSLPRVHTSDDWNWVYQKTPWVMVVSMQEVKGNEGSRVRNMLFCGKARTNDWDGGYLHAKTSDAGSPDISIYSGFDETYDTTYNRGVPGLTEASIEYKGSMGATREVNLKIKLWTDEQLAEYELLFFVPGAGVRVEWGWGLTPTGEVVTPIGFQVMDDVKFQEEAEKKRDEYGGHYEGLQGVVTNFQWSKLSDGSYDCSVTVVTRGEAYLSSPVTSTRKKVVRDDSIETQTTEQSSADSSDKPVLIADMLGVWQTAYKQIGMIQSLIALDSKNIIGPKTTDGKEAVGLSIELDYTPSNEASENWIANTDNIPFVSLQFILTHMINSNLCDVIDGASATEGYPLASDPNVRVAAKFQDDKPIRVQIRPNQLSVNPYVCIIPGEDDSSNYSLVDEDGDGLKPYTVKNPSAFQAFANLCYKPKMAGVEVPIKDDPTKTETKKFDQIDLRFILVNMDHIKVRLDESSTIDEFMGKLLDDIADATGGIWDFSLATEYGLVKIIEGQTVAETNPTPLEINLSTYGDANGVQSGTIRSFTMESDLSSKVATEAMYGSNNGDADPEAGDGNSGEKGEDVTFGFRLYAAKSKNLALGGQGKTKQPPVNNEADGETKTAEDTPDKTLTAAINRVRSHLSMERVTPARRNLNEYLLWSTGSEKKESKPEDGYRPMLPIKLRFSCDGYTLFKTGYLLKPNFLPPRFKDWMNFMVLKTSHNITNSDFSTEVELIMRPIFKQDPNATSFSTGTTSQVTQQGAAGRQTAYTSANAPTVRPRTRTAKDGTVVENGKVPSKWMDKTVKSSYFGDRGMEFEIGAAEDLVALNNAFKAEFGKFLPITDGYRSYEGQVACKQKWIAKGQPNKAATPGTSIHGWGKAFDVDTSWEGKSGYNSKVYKWLRQNGPTYGWDNPSWAWQTGSNPEAWHFEYTGAKSKF